MPRLASLYRPRGRRLAGAVQFETESAVAGDDTIWDLDTHQPVIREQLMVSYLLARRMLQSTALIEILDLNLVRRLHQLMFEDIVPDLAGRFRGPGHPIFVTFGTHRGTPPDRVAHELAELEGHAARLIRQ